MPDRVEELSYDRDYYGGSGDRTTSASEPPPYAPPPPSKRNVLPLYIAGAIILIIGLVLAVAPLTWGGISNISNDWVGTEDEGYYASYDEGSTAIVIGTITDEYVLDPTNDSDLYGMGYRYCYELDYVYSECPLSKKDMGNEGDEIQWVLELKIIRIGGGDTWAWTIQKNADSMIFYIIAAPLLLVGFLMIAAGVVLRNRVRGETPSTIGYQTTTVTTRTEQTGAPTSTCKFCGADMPLGELVCSYCGKSKFDT